MRDAYEDTNPAHVKRYQTGENILANRSLFEGAAQIIINIANTDRPAGIDAGFIQRVQAGSTANVESRATQ